MAEIAVKANARKSNGPTAVKAAGLVTATGASAAVYVGKGLVGIELAWTAIEIVDNDELCLVTIQMNTEAAQNTWLDSQVMVPLGATEVLASSGDATATGSVKFAIDTGYDGYQIREKHWISGTVATGFNFTVNVIPGSFITE